MTPPHQAREGNQSKLIRRSPGAFDWEGIAPAAYKETTETWKGVTRCVLVGERGESPDFHLRYFEIAPGGYSTLESHQHEHVVVGLRGQGEVIVGCYRYPLFPGDVVYVAPGDAHQFLAPTGTTEPFGFYCIVNARRDRPVPLNPDEHVCQICE